MADVLRWDDRWCVGLADVDAQHRGLFALLNELLEARDAGLDSDIIGSILDRLVEYAQTHFATEERYFADFDYPEAESHREQHQDFAAKVALFVQEFEAGEAELTLDLWDFLSSWLLNHVCGSDGRFGRFMTNLGQCQPS